MAIATVHMSLDPGTLGTLSKRGHARLHQLQRQTPEMRLSLDHARKALLLTGPAHRLDDLRQQIAGLLGRTKKVPAALWAELMRTRTSSNGLIARLQHFSGSRIHIERSRFELCIYGSDEQFSIANGLLEHMAKDCIEERLLLETSQIGEQQRNELAELAEASGVAIQVKEKEIIVLGIRDAVKQVCESSFLEAFFDSNLLDDELPRLGMLMHAQQVAQGHASQTLEGRQTSEGTLNSGMWSSGHDAWSRQQTAECLEDQVSCPSVSTAAASDPRQKLFGEKYLGPWIPTTVSSGASSASVRTTPSVPPSSLHRGHLCPFCGTGVSRYANFCFVCGQLVKATPSIQAALGAASCAQPQQCSLLPAELPTEIFMLSL